MVPQNLNNIIIGLLSEFHPDDKRASSGTSHRVYRALQDIGEVRLIPIRRRKYVFSALSFLRKVCRRLTGINIDFLHTRLGARWAYHPVDMDSLQGCDAAVGFFCLHNIYNLRFPCPVIYISDAPLGAMLDYYDGFSNMPRWNRRQAVGMDAGVIRNADRIVFSSDWAAHSAEMEFPDETLRNEARCKVKTVEFGSNLEDITATDRHFQSDGILNLLFVGVDWDRKGGDIAVETVNWLNENGVEACLHVVGIKKLPKRHSKNPNIVNYGFLDKNIPADERRLQDAYRKADLFLLPTKAECSAIVFVEAAARGLPVFTHATGGSGSYVTDGVTERLLPLGVTGKDFGEAIKLTVEEGKLDEMSCQARQLYDKRLNWRVWSQKMRGIISELIDENRGDLD